MRRPFLLTAGFILAAGASFSAEERVRNPFWPQGYQGSRYAISAKPRHPTRTETVAEAKPEIKLKPGEVLKTVTNSIGRVTQVVESSAKEDAKVAVQPVRKTPEEIEDELWKEASRRLRTSNPLSFDVDGETKQSITINGLVYTSGDLVSVNADTNRFTWLVRGFNTNGALRVERVKHRPLSYEETEKTTTKKRKQ